MAIGDLAIKIQESSDSRLRAWLREIEPTSPAWSGIIAEMEYRASKKMQCQTRTLVALSWAIVALTFALLAYTIKLYQDTRAHEKREALEQHAKLEQAQSPER